MRWIYYTIMHENDDVIRFAGVCQNLTNLFTIPSKTGPQKFGHLLCLVSKFLWYDHIHGYQEYLQV